jgi:hypothetical protein
MVFKTSYFGENHLTGIEIPSRLESEGLERVVRKNLESFF